MGRGPLPLLRSFVSTALLTLGAACGNLHSTGNMNPTLTPLRPAELQEIQDVLLFGEADVAALRQSLPILEPRVEEILDVWYGFVGSQPQLLDSFCDRHTGKPDADYLAAVRERFADWILDTARADYDEAWIAQQLEIGLRHHSAKKNRTDGAEAAEIVPFRYLIALHQAVITTLRPFLEADGASAADVDRMQDAWRKSVLLQVILWSQPYVAPEDF